MNRLAIATTLLVLAQAPVAAEAPRDGDHLYKVTTLRAAPGALEALLAWHAELDASGYNDAAGLPRSLVMRHSQGDQWDLLVITPMRSWAAYFSDAAIASRLEASSKHAVLLERADELIAFEEDLFAFGPPWNAVRDDYYANGLYHIEMFEALPGKTSALLEQRRMENEYLAATGLETNMIFRRAAGSDVDVFTIGFHASLEAFATPSDRSVTEKEAAARDAGFKDRADLSFYLRSLIGGHHDTLATRVDH
jgi:hypothetical protein